MQRDWRDAMKACGSSSRTVYPKYEHAETHSTSAHWVARKANCHRDEDKDMHCALMAHEFSPMLIRRHRNAMFDPWRSVSLAFGHRYHNVWPSPGGSKTGIRSHFRCSLFSIASIRVSISATRWFNSFKALVPKMDFSHSSAPVMLENSIQATPAKVAHMIRSDGFIWCISPVEAGFGRKSGVAHLERVSIYPMELGS